MFQINITTSNHTVEPGEEVTFNIHAQPQSRVAIIAIDLRDHLLNSYYNINKTLIIKQLYNELSFTPEDNILFGKQSGLVTITNADVINFTPRSKEDENNAKKIFLYNSYI